MRAVDFIRQKRDSHEHSAQQIKQWIAAYTRGEIPDYQMSAWLMAVVLRGMSRAETAALTGAMLASGRVLDFSDLAPRKVDKHSTGGVGDKTSLVIAPVVAAGGLLVPMISGRGLGHTGGTLDKLESIPGMNVDLSLEQFRRVLERCGGALAGQTKELAPADKKMYALRDVTGTVESLPLICSSIMSKKLAEGLDALVLDVKAGSGAFMKTVENAGQLADLLVDTGRRMGKKVVALLTDMNQPLGRTAGNALEVAEAIEVLGGRGPADLRELCVELAGWMFTLGERTGSVAAGRALAGELIDSGGALKKFREIVQLQGGDVRAIDDPGRLPQARQVLTVASPASGFVAAIECEQLGRACVAVGGGREKIEDRIDPAVGLEFYKRLGDPVRSGEGLCTIYYNAPERLEPARALVESAYRIAAEKPPAIPPLVYRVVGAE